MSNRLCKICKIKPPYLNFKWLIGPSSLYVAKQQRTKRNHQKIYFSYLSMIVFNITFVYCIYINSFWDWAKIYPYHTHSFAIAIITFTSAKFWEEWIVSDYRIIWLTDIIVQLQPIKLEHQLTNLHTWSIL